MLKNLSADHIYIVCGHTDMRKSIDGLAGIIQQQYQLDLFSSSAFLFCGRRRNRLKVLLWEDLSDYSDKRMTDFCCCTSG